LNDLKNLGNPIQKREEENRKRPGLGNTLLNTINDFKKFTTTVDENFSHLTQEDKNNINEECSKVETWYNNLNQTQSKLNLYDDPVLLSNDLIRKK